MLDFILEPQMKDIKMPRIICSKIPKFKEYERKIEDVDGIKNMEIWGVGKTLGDTISNEYNNMSVLYDILELGEYIYQEYEKNEKHSPKFQRTDEEMIQLGEKIIELCNKYGIPTGKQKYFEIYNFSFTAYDIYCRFIAWLFITEDTDLSKANEYIGSNFQTIEDIKEHIVPIEVWDYNEKAITLSFSYNKDNDSYEFVYHCNTLLEVAFLQFNFLFLSEDGIMGENGENLKIKVCSICHNYFATFIGNQTICSKHDKNERERIRKQRSRAKKKNEKNSKS